MNHTPTPWHLASTECEYFTCIEKDDRLIARCGSSDFLQAERDAAFIVRAVNVHESLLSQLIQHHEDAVDPDHFERLAAGELGCTTCALIARAEGK